MTSSSHTTKYTVKKYSNTRFWALYHYDRLVCVTVYKKGALSVIDELEGNAGDTQEECESDAGLVAVG